MISELHFWIGINCMLLYLASVVWHELGHMLYFKYVIKMELKVFYIRHTWYSGHFQIGHKDDYLSVTDQEYLGSLMSGIFLGAFAIFIVNAVSSWMPVFFPYWLMIVPYILGCRSDIDECIKTIKYGDIRFDAPE